MDRTAVVTELPKITKVEPLEERWVRLWFSDGAVKDVDLEPTLAQGGVFAPMRDDRDAFEQVVVDEGMGTIAWPGGVDLDAAVLYGLFEPASGPPLRRRDVVSA
jgi:hypothetical protein